jgi:outer membrane protein assembly factor BamB
MRRSALVLVALVAIGAAARSQPAPTPEWKVWGGPERNFVVPATGLFAGAQAKWISSPPKRLWERPLGDGYSGIAVEGDRLYTGYRQGSSDVFVALEAATGKTIWEFSYAAPFTNAFASDVGPGPYAMPQVVGDRIVTASGIGQIHSIDKNTGRRVWLLDLYKEFGGTRLDFGYSSHALPYKDSLIVLAGGRGSAVLRVRQTDGTPVWRGQNLQSAHSSPLLIDVDGQPQVAILLANEVVGIDPETGDLLWRHPHRTENGLAISTPVWAPGNLLFISTAYSGGARGLRLSRSGNRTTVQELWYNPRIQVHFGSAIRDDGFVYLSNGQSVGILSAVELATGRIAWQVRDFVKAQLLAADGRLIILDEDGNLGIGLATPQRFQALAKWPLLSSVAWTPPTLAGNRLFVRDRKVMMALDMGSLR